MIHMPAIRTTPIPIPTAPAARHRMRELPETPQEKVGYALGMAEIDREPYALVLTPSGLIVAVPSARLSAFAHGAYTTLYMTLPEPRR
jgi:hypothetical protein